MNPKTIQFVRLLAVPLGLLALVLPSHAQLSITGNIEGDLSAITTAGGASALAKYALTPPGYISTASISHTGAGVFTSAFTLKAQKGSGSATLTYKPSLGTADPLNSFGGIKSGDTLGFGSLKLTDTKLPSNGSVNFMWNVEFASVRLFNGVTPVTSLFTNVPILSVPLTLSLVHTGNVATLSLTSPFNLATMFTSLITLDNGYEVGLSPATTLTTLINMLSTGAFKATPSAPMSFGTVDGVVTNIISPVPEASTYALWSAALLVGVALVRRTRRTASTAPAI